MNHQDDSTEHDWATRMFLRSYLWKINHAAMKGNLPWERAEEIVVFVEYEIAFARGRPFRPLQERRIKYRMLRSLRRIERHIFFDFRNKDKAYLIGLIETISEMADMKF